MPAKRDPVRVDAATGVTDPHVSATTIEAEISRGVATGIANVMATEIVGRVAAATVASVRDFKNPTASGLSTKREAFAGTIRHRARRWNSTWPLQPEKNGVESLARQIKHTGRSYPLFDIARLILAKPERYLVVLKTRKKEDGSVAQPLFFCQVDETVWLSEDQALDHVLSRHFDTFYKTDKTEIDPPKGTYTFVAQCGMSDQILGPPNYHGYQDKLRALHADRFPRLPFDVFKSRVKIIHDEEVVKQWLDDQSWKTEYIAINLPEEARLESREAVREHFREHHLSNLISGVSDVALKASVFNKKTPPRMQNLVRYAIDDQRRFPLKIVNMLSQEFSSHGLQFFKRKKSVTHVSVSRPHHLNLDHTPVSDSIRNIVTFVVDNQNCTRRMILDKFVPEPDKPESAEVPAEGDAPKPDTPLSPERTAILSDLHWLVHQGHVVEYANGQMEIAPKPQPPQQKKKKPRPDKKPKAEPPVTGGTRFHLVPNPGRSSRR